MEEEQIRQIIRSELQNLLGHDRYTFQKDIDVFDFRNIKLGKSNGTMLGTENTQKLAFWGLTPVVQPTAVANATADVNDLASSLNDLLAKLRTIGIIDT